MVLCSITDPPGVKLLRVINRMFIRNNVYAYQGFTIYGDLILLNFSTDKGPQSVRIHHDGRIETVHKS